MQGEGIFKNLYTYTSDKEYESFGLSSSYLS